MQATQYTILCTIVMMNITMADLRAADINPWRALNAMGLVSSLGSFACFVPITVNMVNRYGFQEAWKTTHIPRLIIDSACVAAACYGTQAPTFLNIACLLGSIGSFAQWTPVILANPHRYYGLRLGIDALQALLAVHKIVPKIL